MPLPARIADYTDFYVWIHHATKVGRLSGEALRRQRGQQKQSGVVVPTFGLTGDWTMNSNSASGSAAITPERSHTGRPGSRLDRRPLPSERLVRA